MGPALAEEERRALPNPNNLLRRKRSHPNRRGSARPVLGVKAKPAARGASRALTPARGSGLRLP